MAGTNDKLIPDVPAGATRKCNVLDILEQLKDKKPAKILLRVDYNVPMDDATGKITDDSRVRKALPTLQAILDAGHVAVVCSHLGRPKLVQQGGTDAATVEQRTKMSLAPVAQHLQTLLGSPDKHKVVFADDCLKAKEMIDGLSGGSVCVLENLRFYKAEEKNEAAFAEQLASYADAYINDAFGTCHRAHASTAGVPAIMSLKGIGALVASELAFLDFTNTQPKDKISAIIGGSKVSTKLPVIQGLLNSTDVLILGGGLAYTFLKAQGVNIGSSLCEDSMLETAKDLMAQAKASGKQMVLPVDAVCSKTFPKGPMDKKDTITVDTTEGSSGVPDGYMGLDVGPKTVKAFIEAMEGSTKLVFNGPMGVFEVTPFDEGTRGLVDGIEAVTKAGTISVVGGGDSVAALEAFGKTEAVSYVSTGGGATLELLAGDKLPGVEAIPNFEG